MPAPCICPSLLSSDFSQLGSEVDRMLAAGADWMHVDIMDGHFVPNLTLGPPIVASLRKHSKNAFLDCHCMVSDIYRWIEPLARAGASQISFHPESLPCPAEMLPVIDAIHQSNIHCGIAIKPMTDIESLIPFIKQRSSSIHTLLVMTVEPGFGGQKFMPEMMNKVMRLRELFPTVNVQVDGGLNLETTAIAAEAGANCIVAGTAIFGSSDPAETIRVLRQAMVNAV